VDVVFACHVLEHLPALQSYANIDDVFAREFAVVRAAYMGDDSMNAHCRRHA
jgi:hypothetical protein